MKLLMQGKHKMKWFKHDSNANMDAKLKRIRAKYGFEGYGIYWYCLELIAQNIDKNNLTFELEHDAELIAMDTGLHIEMIQEIMHEFVKLNLFENTDGIITCLKMRDRTDEYTQQVMRNRQSIGSNSRVSRDNIRGIRIEQNRIEQNRIEQNRKEKEKKKKTVAFKKPTIAEIQKHITEQNLDIDAEEFFYHYEANDWFRGKTKIKSWKACLQTWKRKNKGNEHGRTKTDNRTRAKRVADKLDEIAKQDIEQNGFTEFVD